MAYTYILRLSNNQYYVGSTINLQRRIQEHKEGKDFYTKAYLPIELVYFEEYETKKEACKREYQLKGWSRAKKEKLINGEWGKYNRSLSRACRGRDEIQNKAVYLQF